MRLMENLMPRMLWYTQSCIESIKRRDKLTDKQQEAYYWMLIQPYIAIDPFGMAVLTPEQEKTLLSYADEIQRSQPFCQNSSIA